MLFNPKSRLICRHVRYKCHYYSLSQHSKVSTSSLSWLPCGPLFSSPSLSQDKSTINLDQYWLKKYSKQNCCNYLLLLRLNSWKENRTSNVGRWKIGQSGATVNFNSNWILSLMPWSLHEERLSNTRIIVLKRLQCKRI